MIYILIFIGILFIMYGRFLFMKIKSDAPSSWVVTLGEEDDGTAPAPPPSTELLAPCKHHDTTTTAVDRHVITQESESEAESEAELLQTSHDKQIALIVQALREHPRLSLRNAKKLAGGGYFKIT